jgi:hypothetical protein
MGKRLAGCSALNAAVEMVALWGASLADLRACVMGTKSVHELVDESVVMKVDGKAWKWLGGGLTQTT